MLEDIYKTHHQARDTSHLVWKTRRLNFFKEAKGKKVLDVGCRDGAFSILLDAREVFGLDIDRDALSRAPFPTKQVDLSGDWEIYDKFEVVLMTEVLEHLYFPHAAILKARMVLEEGGVLLGSVPHAYSWRNRLRFLLGRKHKTSLEDPTHINHFLVSELEEILGRQFKTVEIKVSKDIILFRCVT